MLRKIVLALTASAALGAAALVPNSASAFGGHWGGGWHGPWLGVGIYPAPVYTGCVVRRWVQTPAGPRLRWVNICY